MDTLYETIAAATLLLAFMVYQLVLARTQLSLARAEQSRLARVLGSVVPEHDHRLVSSRHATQVVLDALPSTVAWWSSDLVNRFANRAFGDWHGFDALSATGRHMRDVLGAELFESNRPYVEAALRGEPQRFERILPRLDGNGVRHTQHNYLPEIVDGKVQGFFSLSFEIGGFVDDRQRQADLHRDNDILLRAINAYSVYLVSNRRGRIIDVNDNICSTSGYTRGELIGQPMRMFNSNAHDRQFWLQIWHCISTGQSWRGEICYRAKDDSIDWVDSIICPVIGEDGQIDRTIWLGTVITARNRREHELQRSNVDLEQFAYVASHDLQEPLRMVASYTELLAQRYRGKLDERADKYIFYATDGAKRMQRLISDLLAFSRIGSQGRTLTPVSAGAVLRRVLEPLQKPLADTRAVVDIRPLPTVMADEGQLEQLFQNLLGNALKFRSDAAPHIVIDAKPYKERWLFSVKDNGMGFEMQYAERIFRMFQRLHERGRFEGSGIGLSIVKRIVERHGGEIFVESEPGKGTAFYFTLQGA